MKLTHSDQEFRKLIEESIERLAPYFGLSSVEVTKCKEFGIRRNLTEKVYQDHSKKCAAYSFLDNFFFFPKRQYLRREFQICYPEASDETFESILGLTSTGIINHETGHRIHAFVNPDVKLGVLEALKTGKRPEYHFDLTEIIAEYGNMILSKRDYENGPFSYCHNGGWKIYSKFGPEFLKVLARMPLQEAIKKGLFCV
jgi:hypothetical protein